MILMKFYSLSISWTNEILKRSNNYKNYVYIKRDIIFRYVVQVTS